MSDVFLTVVSGTLVFTLGQLIANFLLTPLIEYKKTKNKVSLTLSRYSDILTGNRIENINAGIKGEKNVNVRTDSQLRVEMSITIAEQAAAIENAYFAIPFVTTISRLPFLNIPTAEDMTVVYSNLYHISYSLDISGGHLDYVDYITAIHKKLRMKSIGILAPSKE